MTLPCLGTAGFGLRYGVANTHGQPTRGEVFAMLDLAWARGVRAFDTAPAYGDAETLLGEYRFPPERPGVLLVTKTPPTLFDGVASDGEALERAHRAFWRSTQRLGQPPKVWLLHRSTDVFNPRIVTVMRVMREQTGVAIGVSCYGLAEAEEAIREGFTAIQVPLSVLDDRFESSGVLTRARTAGLKIFARSPFCQGAVTLNPELAVRRLPASDATAVMAWWQEAASFGRADGLAIESDPSLLALAWATRAPDVDYTVFGVDSVSQFCADLSVFDAVATGDRHPDMIQDLREGLRRRVAARTEGAVVLPSPWGAA
jgi:aryl-alcohol dehydrogenase-like predicted oxidoreductase